MLIDKWGLIRSYVSGIADNAASDTAIAAANILSYMENLDTAEKAEHNRLIGIAKDTTKNLPSWVEE